MVQSDQKKGALGVIDKKPKKQHPHAKKKAPQKSPKPNTPGLNARITASQIVARVLNEKASFDTLIDHHAGDKHFLSLPDPDRRHAHAISMATLRHHGQIKEILKRYLKQPLDTKAPASQAILASAIAQIVFMKAAQHAAVGLAVEAAKKIRSARPHANLINGVLRNITRALAAGEFDIPPTTFNCPRWLAQKWEKSHGKERVAEIMQAACEIPALDITVKANPKEWSEKLSAKIQSGHSLSLMRAGKIEDLSGYEDGEWWIQDEAATLPVRLMGDVKDKKILDLCAAPGGKTLQLAAAGAKVTALDISKNRMVRLKNNLERTGLNARCVISNVFDWQPDEKFDAILLDAPCSATGTLRRNPDIVWTNHPEKVAELTILQEKMLNHVAEWLSPGGILLYSTCSLEKEEGEERAEEFIKNSDFTIVPVKKEELGTMTGYINKKGYLRTFPHLMADNDEISSRLDGFFLARFQRN